MLLDEAGYVSFPDRKFHFYLKDHQGNTRVVADKDGNVEETNAYYPFGGNFTSTANIQPYKYNGKELDTRNGLNWYDYGARHYDAAIGRWHVVDPLSEKYSFVSPYVYCMNNPMKFIDPDGKGDFIDEKGRYIGNDGNDDGKLYLIKTIKKHFDNDAPSAGISSKEAKATTNFIKENSGNSEAFSKNLIAYSNSVEIISDKAIRKQMVDIVNQDSGTGGTSDENNREYGGVVRDNEVKESPKGPVSDPLKQDHTDIAHPDVRPGDIVFHSHPSGRVGSINTETGARTDAMKTTKTGRWDQAPSKEDVNNASGNEYVFARGSGKVYIYNKSGVVATMPHKSFVNIKNK